MNSGVVRGLLFPALIAFAILFYQAPLAPYQDDYGAILQFADDYQQLGGLKTKLLNILTTQSNEYKLAFEHSIVAAELELTGHLNFSFLTAMGSFFLLPMAYLLCLIYGGNQEEPAWRLLSYFSISLLFFALTYWENLDWAMTGLQNLPVILFSLVAIYLLSRDGHPFFACLAAMLAPLSSANGFLLLPVGLLLLLSRHAYRKGVAWCAAFIPPLAAYVYHFTPSVAPKHHFFYVTRPLFFFALLGSAVPFRWLALALGVLLVIAFLFSMRLRFDRLNPAGFYFGIWVLATSALVAWVRGGVAFYTASRYSIYSILMLIYCYSFLARVVPARWITRKRFYVASTVMAGALFVFANANAYQKLGVRRRMIVAGIEHYRANPESNSPMIDPLVEQTVPAEKAMEKAILTNAVRHNIYALPPRQEIR